MRKIFKRYIITIFGVSIFFTILLTTWWSYTNILSQEEEIFKSISEHLKFNIVAWEKEKETFEEGLKRDYLLKVELFREYINYSPNIIYDKKKMMEIRDLLAVNEVHVTNSTGEIIGSSISKNIGFNINSNNKLKSFAELLNTSDKDKYVFQNLKTLTGEDKNNKYYLVMKRLDNKGIVLIGLYPRRLLSYRKNNIFEIGLDRTPVTKGTFIFLLNRENLSIFSGISGNDVAVKNYLKENNKEVLENILSNDKYINILGKKYYIRYEEYKNYLIVRAVEVKNLYTECITNLIFISVSMVIILLILIFNLKKVIEKKILLEIEKITKGLEKISQGEFQTLLKESKIMELNSIVLAINNVVNVFSETSNKFENVVRKLNIPIGMFFYLPELNYLSISENIKELLGVLPKDWEVIKNNKDKWLNYLEKLKVTTEEEEVCQLRNGSYIRIILSKNLLTEVYFGVIQDVTQEEVHKKDILKKLELTSEIAQKDYLTGVLKKEVGIIEVEEKIENSEGIFLIFDLDNFKKINDTFGHIEGDNVLIEFSNILKESFKENTIISRMGGDEFSVFITRKLSNESIKKILDDIFYKIDRNLEKYVKECDFSVSIGGVFLNKKYSNYEEIYHQADKGLYKAKRKGKKQYYFYTE